jgi:hypothetical protein
MKFESLLKAQTEHSHQKALFAWANIAYWQGFEAADNWANGGEFQKLEQGVAPKVPQLLWLHAIPNGGSRGDSKQSRSIRGGQLKAEGVKPGIPDIFLPLPVEAWHGLYIEMKKPSVKPKKASSRGGVSDEQIEFRDYAHKNGYGHVVCYSWKEAADILKEYVGYATNTIKPR